MKIYAMYLPQFHDCPFNSQWWGKGFTEWNNVREAKPLFGSHRQPRVPLNGYYDLSDPEQIETQAREAAAHGIDGFIFYHYWYEGKRPLSRPVDRLRERTELAVPYALCWANHSWTRSWTNRMGALDTLIAQTYESSSGERIRHIQHLVHHFSDRRYILIDRRPLLQIYQPQAIPALEEFLTELRNESHRMLGVTPHISAMFGSYVRDQEFLRFFDSVTLFQPSAALHSPRALFSRQPMQFLNGAGISGLLRAMPNFLKRPLYRFQDAFVNKHRIYDYDVTWGNLLAQAKEAVVDGRKVFLSAFVDFDNSPRYRRRARLFTGFTPAKFSEYLAKLLKLASQQAGNDDSVVFINAWNEWGEGMYLEPDTEEGYARLQAVRMAVASLRGSPSANSAQVGSVPNVD